MPPGLPNASPIWWGAHGVATILRKAVNTTGSTIRKDTKAIAPALYGAPMAALSIQGRAARPGSDDPAYRLRMAAKVPISRLKAKHRRARREAGRLVLKIDTPSTDPIRFAATAREGKAFRLLEAGPLVERFVGGIATKARSAFGREEEGGQAELSALRKRAARDLPNVVAAEIAKFMQRRRRT